MRNGKYSTIKVYARLQKTRNFDPENYEDLYHGYGVRQCSIHFMTAGEGTPFPERAFSGYRRKADFAMRYEHGYLYLLEFSTEHDVNYSGKLRGKLNGYDLCLPDIEHDFAAKCIVVFVLDVSRDRVRSIVEKYNPSGNFFFCDFDSLNRTEMGKALVTPIWIWKDGKEYSLKK